MRKPKDNNRFGKFLFILFGIGVITSLFIWIRTRIKKQQIQKSTIFKPFKYSVTGLSDAEVAERQSGDRVKARLLAEQQEQILQGRRRIFSIFNVTMLVLAVSQLTMKDIWGALGTLGALVLNISISLFQQSRSAREVGKLLSMARPMATVIRNSVLKTIDQDDIVLGDVLVVGKGDEFFAKGVLLEASNLLVDESHIVPDGGHVTKRINDPVYPGTFCEGGWAAYRVEYYPEDIDRDEIGMAATPISEIQTPLQKSIRSLMVGLLVIAGIFYGIILLDLLRLDVFPPEILTMYRQVMSIIFSIAPAGLIFMIVVNYAVGSANIAKSGALVRNSLAIESLAQVTSMCIIRRDSTDAIGFKIEMLLTSDGEQVFTESRTRQLLGNYAHSARDVQYPLSIFRESLDGENRPVDQQARYISLLGWEAVTFLSEDMFGTYVIGEPQFLEPYLVKQEGERTDEPLSAKKNKTDGNFFIRVSNLFKNRKQNDKEQLQENITSDEKMQSQSEPQDLEITPAIESEDKPNDRSLLKRISGLFKKNKAEELISEIPDDSENTGEVLRLLFAYSPEKQKLFSQDLTPVCPKELTPICILVLVKEARPEMQNAVDQLLAAGASIKVLTTEEPEVAVSLANELGLIEGESQGVDHISGADFSQVLAEHGLEILKTNTIFAQLNSDQMLEVIRGLQSQGEFVAVRGNSISDLPVMLQADLNISRQGNSPKVLSKADIILMGNSPDALPSLLRKGQNIVQSVIDMMKLNLTEIGYLLILLILMFITGNRNFIYQPIHGGVIGIITIVIPSFFISFWSTSIKLTRININRQLNEFIIPASITISIFILAAFYIARGRGVGLDYTQQLITHLLLFIGLLLVILVQPPTGLFSVDKEPHNDWRLTWVVISLFVAFNLLTFVPLFQRYLHVLPLQHPIHYLLIWGAALIWAIVTMLIWRLRWKSLTYSSKVS